MIHTVYFLELDNQDDYLLSFWLDERGDRHVTVLRPREYDPDLAAEDRPRPVLFTHEKVQPRGDLLLAAEWDGPRVRLRSQQRDFEVDVSRLRDAETLALAKLILKRMNYDGCFDLLVRRGPRKPKGGSPAKERR